VLCPGKPPLANQAVVVLLLVVLLRGDTRKNKPQEHSEIRWAFAGDTHSFHHDHCTHMHMHEALLSHMQTRPSLSARTTWLTCLFRLPKRPNLSSQCWQWWFLSPSCCYKETQENKQQEHSENRWMGVGDTCSFHHNHCTCTRHYSAPCRHGCFYLHVPLC
jgi:hypothetical protein